MPLYNLHDVRPCLGYLRTPPLLFGRRPPQSNYPAHTVLDPDYGPKLEPQLYKGGAISISLSLWWRQCGHRYAIRAGRNLPDKEFRYLRTVIVTAAVYRGFDQELRRS